MADPRFFQKAGPFTVGDLAEAAEAELASGAPADRLIQDVAPLEAAGPDHVSFLDNKKYLDAFATSAAGVCIVHPAFADRAPAGMALLLSKSPYRSYALVAQLFYPSPRAAGGVAPSASVDSSAVIDPEARIEAGAVVGAGARIAAGAVIRPNAVIGAGVEIGEDTEVGACASLSHCLIGRRVRIYPGVRIGQDGFGFAMDPRGHLKVPQLGRVIVEDDVEIGANATIDRGAGPDTVIGRGCMIDNLVQIGHNVEIGAGSVLVAQSGIAGSSKLGDFVVLAAQAGIAGHLKVGSGVRIGGQSGVMRDVDPGQEVIGSPAVPVRQFWRQYARFSKLSDEKGR
ncbi:UDP-3-O-(3-hydroxymyristoyl)glucosamine N-acyltransferase [Inquilinus sp. CAU 1745]|uniref:UDP-3-O-(3-hydroxymyristoyl)glucosamine N-acyltransferase n=1 Tax=Inquilinus sp. CAU 1745 TaxID=3140369 RepID=UPI00325B3C6D